MFRKLLKVPLLEGFVYTNIAACLSTGEEKMILKKYVTVHVPKKKEKKKRRKTDLKYVTVHVQKKVKKKRMKIESRASSLKFACYT